MDIPAYPGSRSLALADKPLFDGIFQHLQPRVSELTFAGLYLFRNAHSYRVTMVGDALVILGEGYDRKQYCLPPLTGAVGKAVKKLVAEGFTLYGADEDFIRKYLEGNGFKVTEDRDNFDYLYLRQEMAELPGNRYHKKRNRIQYFTSRHQHQIEHYSQRYLDGCLGLLEEWGRVRTETGSGSRMLELEANREALQIAGELELKGLVVVVEGAVKGFVIGERLNRQTSVCQFEKADPFLEGLYQLADREFNRLLFLDCTYVNREQDLGEPNLRESKLSYHPLELVRKYRVIKA